MVGALGGIAFSGFGWAGIVVYTGVLMVVAVALATTVISRTRHSAVES